ncbi:hypothetical protein [Pseudomonas sp. BP7]|nr:hypothetical protein [Pseudomonas sp. BP7]MBP2271405.1 hypothetical protein [Pseudomonas sp. BP6]HDS1703052.1 hypothetical protein [Pseudomonas putida]
MSRDNVAGLDHISGMGDPFIGIPFWLHVDRERREYLTVGAWLYLPLGEYDHEDFLIQERTVGKWSCSWATNEA